MVEQIAEHLEVCAPKIQADPLARAQQEERDDVRDQAHDADHEHQRRIGLRRVAESTDRFDHDHRSDDAEQDAVEERGEDLDPVVPEGPTRRRVRWAQPIAMSAAARPTTSASMCPASARTARLPDTMPPTTSTPRTTTARASATASRPRCAPAALVDAWSCPMTPVSQRLGSRARPGVDRMQPGPLLP